MPLSVNTVAKLHKVCSIVDKLPIMRNRPDSLSTLQCSMGTQAR